MPVAVRHLHDFRDARRLYGAEWRALRYIGGTRLLTMMYESFTCRPCTQMTGIAM